MIPKVNNWPLHSHADLSIYTWTHSFTHTRTHIYTCAAYTDKSSLFFFTFYTKLCGGEYKSMKARRELLISWICSYRQMWTACEGFQNLILGSFQRPCLLSHFANLRIGAFQNPWRNRLEKKCEHIHIKIFNFAKGKINFLFRKGGIKWSFVAEIFNTLEISITICLYSSNEQKVFNKTINYIAVARK